MEISSGSEAVFATFIWPVLALFGIVSIVTWPLAKFYENYLDFNMNIKTRKEYSRYDFDTTRRIAIDRLA